MAFGAKLSVTMLGPGFPPHLPTSACSHIAEEGGYCAVKSSLLTYIWGCHLQDFKGPSSLPSLEKPSQGSHSSM